MSAQTAETGSLCANQWAAKRVFEKCLGRVAADVRRRISRPNHVLFRLLTSVATIFQTRSKLFHHDARHCPRINSWSCRPGHAILNLNQNHHLRNVRTLTIDILQKTNAAGRPEVTLALDGNLDNSTVASLEAKL